MNGSKRLLMILPALALLPSCVTMKHQLDQTKPLEINVNVKLQVDRELDEFFAFEDKYRNGPAGPATQPGTQPAASAVPGSGA